MSAVLRAYGDDFDLDAFLPGCTLPVYTVKRRGEPVFPNTRPEGRRHSQSGVHVLASGADFEEFPKQVEDATAFLLTNVEQIERLCQWPGVEGVTLDFGIQRRDEFVQCIYFPSELLRAAGSLGLNVELSVYETPAEETGA